MTVGELIQRLQAYDPELPVAIEDTGGTEPYPSFECEAVALIFKIRHPHDKTPAILLGGEFQTVREEDLWPE